VSNTYEAATLRGPEGQDSLDPTFQYQSVDPNDPPWGLGGGLLVWFLSVCLIVFVPQIFLIPYVISSGFKFGTPDDVRAMVAFAMTDKYAVVLQIVALLPSHLLTLLLVWALVTRFGKRPFWSAIGWGWAPGFGLGICILLGVVLFGVGSLIAWLLGDGKPTPLEQIINSSLAARYLIAFFAVATAPFVEEFIYRGVLYAPLQRLVGVSGAVVLVLAIFTIIHVPQYWPNVGVISAVALLSIVLTVIRAYSGRLLPCIAIHLVFNGIQAVLLMLEPFSRRFVPMPEPVAPPAMMLLSLIGSLF
jgi:membrane protease YdiL (CAAX protease family)